MVGLSVEPGRKIQEIPEYSEYLRQKGEIINQQSTVRPRTNVSSTASTNRFFEKNTTTNKLTKAPNPTTQLIGKNLSVNLNTLTTTLPFAIKTSQQSQLIDEPFINFPSIQLCKDSPADNNIYGHIFCWAMLALYALLFFSLVIYQLRSILWIRENAPRRKTIKAEEGIQVDASASNGQFKNYHIVAPQLSDAENSSRVLTMRPITPPFFNTVSGSNCGKF